MTATGQEPRKLTVAAFDAYVEQSPEDDALELIDGIPIHVSDADETHEQIAANIGANLKRAMDKRRCRTYRGIMVQASADAAGSDKCRPDVAVRCGPPSANTFITDPVVVVEVLSNSTMDLDRGRKLQFYKRLPTAQHIVLAHADQMRVEHYFRTESGWDRKVLSVSESVLELAAVEFRMDLGSVYFDVHF
jgi:Uma2 family endonuclease